MIQFYNSLTRKKEEFTPINPNRVGMYACGPTVYNSPHVGNARSAIVYDLIFRILRHKYGAENVIYVRNITDVDDKIIAAAKENNEPIQALTDRVTKGFHEDMMFLGCMSPSIEPKATTHIAEMIDMISRLLEKEIAYIANGNVYFDVTKYNDYTKLSGRSLSDMLSEVRVEHSEGKRNPHDFVLWKPADEDDVESSIYDSPFGKGRPGWHIECSAMSSKYLGQTFDIHGGGADLMFPHHTNEIAQSCCAFEGSKYAVYWVHNGFVTVNGEKMSKSLKNFITVESIRKAPITDPRLNQTNDLKIGFAINGAAVRFALMSTHYRKPLDFNDKLLSDSAKSIEKFYKIASGAAKPGNLPEEFISALYDDVNISEAIALMHSYASNNKAEELLACIDFLNINYNTKSSIEYDKDLVNLLIAQRAEAKANRDFAKADDIRNKLKDMGIIIEDLKDGTTIIKLSR